MNRAGHFGEGRMERPGGLFAQAARVIQVSEIMESERSVLWSKDAKRQKAKARGRGR